MKIIVVEDNLDLLQELVFMLQHRGHKVRGAATGAELDRHLANDLPDIVLLDVCLPDEDGFGIAERLRRLQPQLGVVMLTGRGSVEDRVRGLKCGADHYLVKPVDRRELLAVLDRMSRRLMRVEDVSEPASGATQRSSEDAPEFTSRPTWALDSRQLRIYGPLGRMVELTARELDILLTLIYADGRPVARKLLLESLGRGDGEADQRALEVKVSRLRRKLREINAGEAPLRAEWGAGYVFAERCQVITR